MYYIGGESTDILKDLKELIIKYYPNYNNKKHNLKPFQLIKRIEENINADYCDEENIKYLVAEYGEDYLETRFGKSDDLETILGREFWNGLYSDGSGGDM